MTVEVVSMGTFEQVKWERDTAISQLEEIGKSLGSKMDDVKKVRHGHWIPKEYMSRTPFARNHICSCCNASPTELSNYCPNCGAKMDGKDDEK